MRSNLPMLVFRVVARCSLLLLALFAEASAPQSLRVSTTTERFVSPIGSDANSGASIDAPWQTIDHARLQVRSLLAGNTGEGDVVQVWLLEGMYTLTKPLQFDALDGRPSSTLRASVRYSAHPSNVGPTTISDLHTLAGPWTRLSEQTISYDVFATNYSGPPSRQILINRSLAVEPRAGQDPKRWAHTTDTGYELPDDFFQTYWEAQPVGAGGERDPIELIYTGVGSTWSEARCRIADIRAGTAMFGANGTTVTMAQPCWAKGRARGGGHQAITSPRYVNAAAYDAYHGCTRCGSVLSEAGMAIVRVPLRCEYNLDADESMDGPFAGDASGSHVCKAPDGTKLCSHIGGGGSIARSVVTLAEMTALCADDDRCVAFSATQVNYYPISNITRIYGNYQGWHYWVKHGYPLPPSPAPPRPPGPPKPPPPPPHPRPPHVSPQECVDAFFNKTLVQVPTLPNLLTVTNASGIAFEGITFEGSTWLGPNTGEGFIDRQGGELYMGTPGVNSSYALMPGAVTVSRGHQISFHSCVFQHLGAAALLIADGSQGVSVTSCVFSDNAGGAILIGDFEDPRAPVPSQSAAHVIHNNTVLGPPVMYRSNGGIVAGFVRDTVIEHNTVVDMTSGGIEVGWGWAKGVYNVSYAGNNSIRFNFVNHSNSLLRDLGPLYVNGYQHNSVMADNWVLGVVGSPSLYPDEGSRDWLVTRNVVENASEWLSAYSIQ